MKGRFIADWKELEGPFDVTKAKEGHNIIGQRLGDKYNEQFVYSRPAEDGRVFSDRGFRYEPKNFVALGLFSLGDIAAGQSVWDKKSERFRTPTKVTVGAVYFKEQPDQIKMRNRYDVEPAKEFIGWVSPRAVKNIRPRQEFDECELYVWDKAALMTLDVNAFGHDAQAFAKSNPDRYSVVCKLKCPWGCFH